MGALMNHGTCKETNIMIPALFQILHSCEPLALVYLKQRKPALLEKHITTKDRQLANSNWAVTCDHFLAQTHVPRFAKSLST